MTKAQKLRNEDIMKKTQKSSIELWVIYSLIDMAKNDEYPDGSFSDNECCLWSTFRRMLGE